MGITKYILEITVFICGAVVMIFELAGSRVLAPYFGTSIFIWTSLIGIILGSLSLGYHYGGKIADKNPSYIYLSLIIFLAAVCIEATILIKGSLLGILRVNFSGIRITSVIASIILFMPTSILLGMVSPYAAKLKLKSLNTTGATIGNLYAISTAGSIFGTFLAGFYLIPHFGTNKLLIILTITLTLVSIALSIKQFKKIKIGTLIIFIISLATISKFNYLSESHVLADVDTAYSRVWIYDFFAKQSDRKIRRMLINNSNSSSMFLDSDELASKYAKFYYLAEHFNPDFKKTLILGGAAYSFPKNFLQRYKEATMDVVEIDPKVTDLAKKYFNLKDDPRLAIYHEDARVYINRTQKKYDIIYGDAFNTQFSIPYQLTTKETVQKKYDILNDQGMVIVNIISSIDGKNGQFLRAEYLTFKSIFPQVYLFPVNNPKDAEDVQNIILVALKSNEKQIFSSPNSELNEYLEHLWTKKIDLDKPILTDDHAPVDYYISKTIL